ncbi:MAG: type I DNA topoisomerase [Endozoicomonadaceae bacterium]|nr:type I DNA topoisomerase [Endozoicomonadaceae bacterium]
MMKKLILVESPGKTKTIQSYLGDGWIVKSSVGHVRDLPSNELGIELDSMSPNYVFSERGREVVKNLRATMKSVNEVYLATDLDREGEAIAWHLKEVLNLTNYKRIVFNEITKSAILDAINNPTEINLEMVHAQEARRLLDRLVGFIVSPELNKLKISNRVSAGRVQSIALKLVCERYLEIKKHRAIEYYNIDAEFEQWTASFDGTLNIPKEFKEVAGEPYRQTNKALMLKLISALKNNPALKIIDLAKKLRKRSAPKPFSTSLLQQAASVHLSLSPDQTMKIAQKLYEKGLITYMRTDSCFLADDAISSIREWISGFAEAKGFPKLLPVQPNVFKGAANAQEAHEAIRPSSISEMGNELEADQKRLYQLIWKRTVASQCAAAEIDQTRLLLHSKLQLNGQQVAFQAQGEIVSFRGWMMVSGDDRVEEKDDTDNTQLQTFPNIEIGDILTANDFGFKTKHTKPPKRYTEASLVKALEDKGVGRPSTYASIMLNIITRKYVVIKKRLLEPTDLGLELFEVLKNANFSFFNYNYTCEVEKALDKVCQNQLNHKEFLQSEYKILETELPYIRSLIPPSELMPIVKKRQCSVCESELKFLRSKKKDYLFRCDPCDYFLTSDETGQVTDSEIPTIIYTPCMHCEHKTLIKLKGKYGHYQRCMKCKKTQKAKIVSK